MGAVSAAKDVDDGVGGGVDDVDETGRHVGAGAVRRDGDVPTTASDGDGRHDGCAARVDDLDGSTRGHDIERSDHRASPRDPPAVADRDGRDDRIRGGVDHRDGVGIAVRSHTRGCRRGPRRLRGSGTDRNRSRHSVRSPCQSPRRGSRACGPHRPSFAPPPGLRPRRRAAKATPAGRDGLHAVDVHFAPSRDTSSCMRRGRRQARNRRYTELRLTFGSGPPWSDAGESSLRSSSSSLMTTGTLGLLRRRRSMTPFASSARATTAKRSARSARSCRTCAASDDRAALARALAAVTDASLALGEYESAIQEAQEAFDIHQRLGQRADAAWDLNAVGLANLYLGRYDNALASYQRALALDRAGGDGDGEITRLNNIGNVHYMRGRYADALRLLSRRRWRTSTGGRPRASRARLRKMTISNLAAAPSTARRRRARARPLCAARDRRRRCSRAKKRSC